MAKISLIVPMYNEEEGVDLFFSALEALFTGASVDYEYICVNDGSKDNTFEKLKIQAATNSKIKIVNFSRNYGKEAALTAGFRLAEGDMAVAIDSDLEEPPETILTMIEEWKKGYKVVYGVKGSRKKDTWLKKITANAFYNVFQKITGLNMPRGAADFILMDRLVIDALNQYQEKNRFTRGLIYSLGFKATIVYFERHKRVAGETKWSMLALFRYGLDAIIANTVTPLRLTSYLGIFFSVTAMLYGLWIVIRTLIYGIEMDGYASLFSAIVFFGGVQLISLGVIGEYIGRIFTETKNRPLYHIEEKINFSKNEQI